MNGVRTIQPGLSFAEAPRWHNGALWFSDVFGHKVWRKELEGPPMLVADLGTDCPSGLGWLPNGDLVIASINTRCLLRLESSGELSEHADLSDVAGGYLNDIAVADDGTVYVGDTGATAPRESAARATGQLIGVQPDGSIFRAAEGLAGPNGAFLRADQRTLIVAETFGGVLTRFDRDARGRLSGRSTWCDLPPGPDGGASLPDGICVDAEGLVWVPDVNGQRILRVREGGEVLDEIRYDDSWTPVACAIGGVDADTLLVCAVREWRGAAMTFRGNSRVDAVDIAPGAGHCAAPTPVETLTA